ncbi:hypothetical protein N658DRAFT_437816 [Parathielavia hyrcaniae]|uniref:HTH psq-type domain-containing protein n=1 Tax=Parathielavia hyrcaniae TaxID=113614 RepID=A0AAN6SWR1_9PEZI|nr:hypothetical protein N658DRAFT_437816 [Parathielavia hyrcaniae]
MTSPSYEARVILALQAIRNDKKLSVRAAVKLYDVRRTTLQNRLAGRLSRINQQGGRRAEGHGRGAEEAPDQSFKAVRKTNRKKAGVLWCQDQRARCRMQSARRRSRA